MTKRWVKVPVPGRASRWIEFEAWSDSEDDWQLLIRTRYLPTHVGPTPPEKPKRT